MGHIFTKEVLEFFEYILTAISACDSSIGLFEVAKELTKAKEILERWKKQDYR